MGHNLCICRYGKVDGKCVGYCDSKCKNGQCIDGKCQCKEGFKKSELKDIRHADYSLYDDDYDYREEDLETCEPICKNCNFGKCLSPDECQCDEGYVRENNICKPVCNNCTEGYCSAPNKCICYPGYKMVDDKCLPHCYGNCPQEKCIRPGFCQCGEGFKWSFFMERCTAECVYSGCKVNEKCDEKVTGKCICDEGFKRDDNTSKCLAICDKPCVNGFCSGPNYCSCDNGFTHKNTTHCEKKCDPMCPSHSSCVNGACECDKNYKKVGSICIPDCECSNGLCLGFGDDGLKCICFPGFIKNPNNSTDCITKCERDGCENGFCGNNKKDCICHLHYQKDNSTGKCVKCEPGTNCNGVFMPYTCDPPCQHGLCVANNTCVCNHGFDSVEGSHTCEPICKGGCAHGVCKSPHNCECDDGYEKVGEKCQPVCNDNCTNGICIAPNTCNCTEGYQFVHNSRHKCEKIKCHHGEHHKNHPDCHTPGKAAAANMEQHVPPEESGVSTLAM